MAEERSTIIERIARFVMQLEGVEEVKKGFADADKQTTQYIRTLRELKTAMDATAKQVQAGVYIPQIQNVTGITKATELWASKIPNVTENLKNLTVEQFESSKAGQSLLASFGFIPPAMEDVTKKAGSLKDAFWSLNSMARALLRIFVAFKVLSGMLGIFAQMADASAKLQAELWRLRAVVEGVSSQIEGGAGSWDSWLTRLDRLRTLLPLVNMTELAEGLRSLTTILGPLGLSADEIERVAGLVGQMGMVMGEEFPSYVSQFITALAGGQRNVGSFGIDLRDNNTNLVEYTASLGLVWSELNAGQREWVRLGYFVDESAKRTSVLTGAEKEEWQQLEELRKKREDILAQSPELIAVQIEWAKVLLAAAVAAERLSGSLDKMAKKSPEWGDAFEKIAFALGMVWKALTGGNLATYEWTKTLEWLATIKEPWQERTEGVEDFNAAVKEGVETSKDQEKAADDLATALSRAFGQAQDAVRSYQQAVAEAGVDLGRRLADIARSLTEKLQDLENEFNRRSADIARDLIKTLADLEEDFQRRRSELFRDFSEQEVKVREDAAEKEQQLREDLDERLRRMEEDHQREMRNLRDEYLMDLEDAARSRDAISMRRITQRYALEKQQREEEYRTNHERAIEDFEKQLQEQREATEERIKDLEKNLQDQLRDLQENYDRQREEAQRAAADQLRDLQENYIRQQEEAKTSAQQQRDDALRNYQERLTDLEMNLQQRLESIILDLIEEEKEWKGTYSDLRTFFDLWYQGDLTALNTWLNERKRLIGEAITFGPTHPTRLPEEMGLARGGFGIARQPTNLLVGERGPEAFAAWPAGGRMPGQSMNIRLTIDGTQSGQWSGNFETQVLRVFRNILQENL